MSWQWQEEYLWQSCSGAARMKAQQWEKDAGQHHKALLALVARQPLTTLAKDAAASAQKEAKSLRRVASRLVVIGTGGSSLGGQALCALAEDPSCVRFLENCDPHSIASMLGQDDADTAWLLISKSGETVETLAAALALADGGAARRARVRALTAAPEGTLARLAQQQDWAILDHPADLGGRFSVFSPVGLIPAAFAGLDIAAIAGAAQAAMARVMQDIAFSLRHAAWLAANAPEKPMQLLMAYADRLRPTTQWYKQLCAESLGKDGKGITPVTAIGAIDQHSQLQLYLDGPRDKLLTLWLPEPEAGLKLPETDLPGLEYLSGRTIGEVMRATGEATVATLAAAGTPLRVLRGKLTPESLADWMVQQMVETLLVAHLLGVDPYSQPAVEAGKKLARASLLGEK